MKKVKHTKLFEWQQRAISGTEKCCFPHCTQTGHLTVDHIVPTFILEQFMLDKLEILYELEENFQIMCHYHNKLKAGRLDPANPKTYTVLSKVLLDAKKEYIHD